MNAYYIEYRDYSNDYTVYAVAREDLDRFLWMFPGAERISLAPGDSTFISQLDDEVG